MKVKGRFDHFNINVTDLDKSIKFYETMTTAIFCWN